MSSHRHTRYRGEWFSDGDHLNAIMHGVLAAWSPGGCIRIWDKTERRWIRDGVNACNMHQATERVMVLAMTMDRDAFIMESYSNNSHSVQPEPARAQDATERARRCLDKMDPSIAGAGGAAQFMKAACVLVRGLSLSLEDALPLLQEYDARSQPQWGLRECKRALQNAKQRSRVPQGAMLTRQLR
jgi:hypothetical protein